MKCLVKGNERTTYPVPYFSFAFLSLLPFSFLPFPGHRHNIDHRKRPLWTSSIVHSTDSERIHISIRQRINIHFLFSTEDQFSAPWWNLLRYYVFRVKRETRKRRRCMLEKWLSKEYEVFEKSVLMFINVYSTTYVVGIWRGLCFPTLDAYP